MVQVMDLSLRMLHPFIPYITEELWGHLKSACKDHSEYLAPKGGWPEALIISDWPEVRKEEGWEEAKVADFALVQEVVRSVRNWRAEQGIEPGKKTPAVLVSPNRHQLLGEQAAMIAQLARIDPGALQIMAAMESKPEDSVVLVVGDVEIYLLLAGLGDRGEERGRLEQELADVNGQIERLESLLAGPFTERAPAHIVQKEQDKLSAFRQSAEKLSAQLKSYEYGS
jgi:valyl-tRNA synthetase